jgi:hypothetical protein
LPKGDIGAEPSLLAISAGKGLMAVALLLESSLPNIKIQRLAALLFCSHRVVQVGNAGITISHVDVGDSGTFTVEIQVFHNSMVTTVNRTVSVLVHGEEC